MAKSKWRTVGPATGVRGGGFGSAGALAAAMTVDAAVSEIAESQTLVLGVAVR
jgi:hypothetical protein